MEGLPVPMRMLKVFALIIEVGFLSFTGCSNEDAVSFNGISINISFEKKKFSHDEDIVCGIDFENLKGNPLRVAAFTRPNGVFFYDMKYEDGSRPIFIGANAKIRYSPKDIVIIQPGSHHLGSVSLSTFYRFKRGRVTIRATYECSKGHFLDSTLWSGKAYSRVAEFVID
jgi:hypothetical protein